MAAFKRESRQAVCSQQEAVERRIRVIPEGTARIQLAAVNGAARDVSSW
jgi:hypothetical protein